MEDMPLGGHLEPTKIRIRQRSPVTFQSYPGLFYRDEILLIDIIIGRLVEIYRKTGRFDKLPDEIGTDIGTTGRTMGGRLQLMGCSAVTTVVAPPGKLDVLHFLDVFLIRRDMPVEGQP
ncbi:hypothetical protein [Thiolapillus sp.]|uniref:hypothetical protein n=1 Tax=Thiolapillus sp. TaxID=2017437 RepID=UPI003AF75137